MSTRVPTLFTAPPPSLDNVSAWKRLRGMDENHLKILKTYPKGLSGLKDMLGGQYDPQWPGHKLIKTIAFKDLLLVIWENKAAQQSRVWNIHFARGLDSLDEAVDTIASGLIVLHYLGYDESHETITLAPLNDNRTQFSHFVPEGARLWIRQYGNPGQWHILPMRPEANPFGVTEAQERAQYNPEIWKTLVSSGRYGRS